MRIMLIEDHPLFRDGVSLILQQLSEGVEIVCGESAPQAIELANSKGPFELILLDYHLKGSTGVDCLSELNKIAENTPIVMLSAENNQGLIQHALQAGAKGFITKSSPSQVMISAIQLVLSGGVYVPPEMLVSAQAESANGANAELNTAAGVATTNTVGDESGAGSSTALADLADTKTPEYHLTERQKEVFTHMLDGLSNKEIAKQLNMSPSTVKVHVAAILRELNVKNRTQAVNIAKTHNIL